MNRHLIEQTLFAEAKHCQVGSDCRALITKPLPLCQKNTLLRLFDENFTSEDVQCHCCYSCIRSHSISGCENCTSFINEFLPEHVKRTRSKSIKRMLKEGLSELFIDLECETLMVEDCLEIKVDDFITDFMRMVDEIKCKEDIVEMWHIHLDIAEEIFQLFYEIVQEPEIEVCILL